MHPTLKTSHQENLRPRLQHTPTANLPLFSFTFLPILKTINRKVIINKLFLSFGLERKYFIFSLVEKQTFNAHFLPFFVRLDVVVSFYHQTNCFPSLSLRRFTVNFFFFIKYFQIRKCTFQVKMAVNSSHDSRLKFFFSEKGIINSACLFPKNIFDLFINEIALLQPVML